MVVTNLQLDLLMMVTNFTTRLAHGGDELYTESCPWWLQTLHWDTLMVVTNLTLAHDGNERYTKTCSCWWQTLDWVLLMLVTKLTPTMGLYREIIEMDWNMKEID